MLAAINALAKPAGPDDDRSAAQRRADALTELARRALDTADLPDTGGARPHLNITIDFHALLGALGAPAGEFAWTGPLSGQTARRLACDAILSRVIIHPDHTDTDAEAEAGDPGVDSAGGGARGVGERVQAILRAALAALPAAIGGARSEPLDVGRASRVVTPAQRALAVRDRLSLPRLRPPADLVRRAPLAPALARRRTDRSRRTRSLVSSSPPRRPRRRLAHRPRPHRAVHLHLAG